MALLCGGLVSAALIWNALLWGALNSADAICSGFADSGV
jgi:hypothetical protein